MTEIMWKVLYELLQIHFCGSAGYAALWHLQDAVKVDLEGCGVPGDPAVMRLLEMGLIVELPDLPYRYRIAVSDEVPALAAEVARLQAQVETMKEALKPFAACAEVWEDSDRARVVHWSRRNVDGLPDLRITVDDLMTARAVLGGVSDE